MSSRANKRVPVLRSKYQDYVRVAESFYAGPDTARTFEYWNAAGVLIYTRGDVEKLWKHLERCRIWATTILEV